MSGSPQIGKGKAKGIPGKAKSVPAEKSRQLPVLDASPSGQPPKVPGKAPATPTPSQQSRIPGSLPLPEKKDKRSEATDSVYANFNGALEESAKLATMGGAGRDAIGSQRFQVYRDREAMQKAILRDPAGILNDLAKNGDLPQVLRMLMFGPGGPHPHDAAISQIIHAISDNPKALAQLNYGMQRAIADEVASRGNYDLSKAIIKDLASAAKVKGVNTILVLLEKQGWFDNTKDIRETTAGAFKQLNHAIARVSDPDTVGLERAVENQARYEGAFGVAKDSYERRETSNSSPTYGRGYSDYYWKDFPMIYGTGGK